MPSNQVNVIGRAKYTSCRGWDKFTVITASFDCLAELVRH